MTDQIEFVGVDWGTSSFRLWVLGRDGTIKGESRGPEGMTVARESGFAEVLDRHLAAAGADPSLPVLICGMAGAKQGWVEAGYVDVPAKLSAIAAAPTRVDIKRDIRILPGLAQRLRGHADVMRGEETQLLGCADDTAAGDCLVAMPGTHSKWVRLEGDTVSGFSTFMTGELFQAIAKQTILSHAFAGSEGVDPSSPAFADAVTSAFKDPARLTSRLFGIRAEGLLFSQSADDAEATLSGLLIGLELAGAMAAASRDTPVILVAEGRLRKLYESALSQIGQTSFTTIDADQAVRQGLIRAAGAIWPSAQ